MTSGKSDRLLAATKAHIAAIESLRESGTLLINCQLGQRRSPTAALILLASLFPGREAALAEWILAEAPYVEYNRWMLSLASGDFRSVIALNRPRVPAPPGCFFELNLLGTPSCTRQCQQSLESFQT
ncbi:hypothetical protein CCR95_18425 [Thiocystis minor]|uniref:hypothetical protein n=1 Tax=Thiocystis minor TaxID=61597 RepID=UPI00191369C7|nr:hypothetical protein [Thiocystis minor]MBK5965998.1 hypothetical protein [Thiocystis minor]